MKLPAAFGFDSADSTLVVELANLDLFFFLLNNDAWRNHHHQAGGLATDTNVFEQAVDVRNVAEERYSAFVPTFGQSLDTADDDRSTVRHIDRCADRRRCERR